MTEEQPDGIDEDSRDIPALARAEQRVRRYIENAGDGLYDEIDGAPLYGRDLEALTRLVRAPHRFTLDELEALPLAKHLGVGSDEQDTQPSAPATVEDVVDSARRIIQTTLIRQGDGYQAIIRTEDIQAVVDALNAADLLAAPRTTTAEQREAAIHAAHEAACGDRCDPHTYWRATERVVDAILAALDIEVIR